MEIAFTSEMIAKMKRLCKFHISNEFNFGGYEPMVYIDHWIPRKFENGVMNYDLTKDQIDSCYAQLVLRIDELLTASED
jgi:hypothetical protein